MIYGIFLLLHISFALLIFFLTVAFLTGAPFVRSNQKAVSAMIRLARIKPGMRVYDLGSGDGTLILEAGKTGAVAVGLEINPFLVLWTTIRIFFSRQRTRTHVRWSNFWMADLSDADVVFVYLLPWRMGKLAAKLKKELKTGSLIISNSFIFPDWPVLRQDTNQHIYVFRV